MQIPRRLPAALAAACATALLAVAAPTTALAAPQAAGSSSLALSLSAPNALYGVTETATLTVRDGSAPVTSGTVTFYGDTGNPIATVKPDAHGQARVTVATVGMKLGIHGFSAAYTDASGTPQGVTSAAYNVYKNNAALRYSPNGMARVSHLAHARYTVTLTSPHVTPTGTFRIYEGRTLLGSATLSRGAATITLPRLRTGLHTLTFTYSGNAVLNAATWTLIMIRSV